MYRIGIKVGEVGEDKIKKVGLSYVIVEPQEQMIASAKGVIGKPYKRGASVLRDAPNAFDCSALVAWSAVESGFSIPRVTIDQYVFSQEIKKEDLKPGDLVFANTQEIIHTEGIYFSQVLNKEVHEESIRTETLEYMPGTKVPGGVDHVGIYTGDNKILHATYKKGGVVEENINESDSFKNIIKYGRIIDDEGKRFVVSVPEDRADLRNKEKLIAEINSVL